ncbi:RDD family protein [Roseovarius nanhaiticus]|uniref:RDD family protein n=1 Tax=Roseovarius nanhaiticus TaxID=573024 RepID=UPI00249397E8|nr:RDD family protein [Roseovarius nanhaiticus]
MHSPAPPHDALPDPVAQPEFYAGVPTKRLLAWLIDSVLILVFCVIALVLTLGIGFFFLPALMLIVGLVYRIATLSRGSATWGMAVMAIELRRHDGTRLDPLTAALHTLGYSASMAFVLPQVVSVLLMLTDNSARGLSDMILGTAMLNRRAAG